MLQGSVLPLYSHKFENEQTLLHKWSNSSVYLACLEATREFCLTLYVFLF